MTDVTLAPRHPAALARVVWTRHRVWLASILILAVLAGADAAQARESAQFAAAALLKTAPFLLLSIGIAAWAGATGADNLIARAFTGAPALMIVMAALAGAVSPFCSCGVIPLIAALLAMGVPLSAVMAFWLASPVMDPSMFVLTAGVLGVEFALAKTLAAIGLGLMGGAVVHWITRAGGLVTPLRDGIGNGGCGGARVRAPKPVVWRFWDDPARRGKFGREALNVTLFLTKWLLLAFLLESLMLAWLPAELVRQAVGGAGLGPVAVATLVAQGMAPGAGLAFLVAGGVTSLPAAIAVWALVRPPVFALYLALSLTGAFLSGILFHLWTLA